MWVKLVKVMKRIEREAIVEMKVKRERKSVVVMQTPGPFALSRSVTLPVLYLQSLHSV